MKIKLLKKLRKRNVIEVRNNQYRVVERTYFLNLFRVDKISITKWGSLSSAINTRKAWILHDARKIQMKPKHIIK